MSKLWEVYIFAIENSERDVMVQLSTRALAKLIETVEYSIAEIICDEHKDAGIDRGRYAGTEDHRDYEANEIPYGICKFIPIGDSEPKTGDIEDCNPDPISDTKPVMKKRDCVLVDLKRIDGPEKERRHLNIHWGNG